MRDTQRLRTLLVVGFFSVTAWLVCVPTCTGQPTGAEDAAISPAEVAADPWTVEVAVDTLWVLVAAFLVFFMNAGFGCVEAGFCRAKNAVNILGKNFVVFGIASLAFWIVGWTIMFGDGGDVNRFLGTSGWFVAGADNSPTITPLADLVKADIKEQYGLDLDDEATAKEHEALLEAIGEQNDKAVTTTEKTDQTFSVALDVPGQGSFQESYSGSDFYWGVFGSISWTGIPLFAKFFFQLVFAGTAATIVSGCVAERIHYKSYMIFAAFLVALGYPITGHWIWGGGWLADWGFWDFAGSTVVHSVGGWAGLMGIILLGPRIGKYMGGKPRALPGHSMALAFLGGMILWLGWFGFNPGSTMGISGSAAKLVAHIVVTTNLACAAGLLAATIVAWVVLGKPDFSMTVNGALAGLVAITAPCAFVSAAAAIVIGLVAGTLVVFSVICFDRCRIDDPVGALSVHLVNGIWGTLSIGLFSNPEGVGFTGGDDGPLAGLFYGGGITQLWNQLVGVVAVGAFTIAFSIVVWLLIKAAVGLRVEAEAETKGLDLAEMGMEAYAADPMA